MSDASEQQPELQITQTSRYKTFEDDASLSPEHFIIAGIKLSVNWGYQPHEAELCRKKLVQYYENKINLFKAKNKQNQANQP